MQYIDQCDHISVTNIIENCLSSFAEYSIHLRDRLSECTILKKYPKGSYIIREGQYLKGCYSIVSGCVKEFYYSNKEQKVTHFYVEDDTMPIAIVPNEIKVNYNWECLEDTIVTYESSYNKNQIFKEFPFLYSMSFQHIQHSFNEYREARNQFILSSPEERYLNLIDQNPALINRLPQYEIANYIGIKAESLSRIRKRLYEMERN